MFLKEILYDIFLIYQFYQIVFHIHQKNINIPHLRKNLSI
jgi:hypothetical protein